MNVLQRAQSIFVTLQRKQEVNMRIQLTLSSRHLFSLMAPRQPRKPVTMTMAPMAMTMLAADSEGNEGEKVAKLPWDTESQMPTPSSPQPHNCKEDEKKKKKIKMRHKRRFEHKQQTGQTVVSFGIVHFQLSRQGFLFGVHPQREGLL